MQISSKFQLAHEEGSSSSNSSSSDGFDTSLKRFNKLLHATLARHWEFFTKSKHPTRVRGRSISDVGLSIHTHKDSELGILGKKRAISRRSLQEHILYSEIHESSTGGSGSAVGLDEHSDSDVDRPRQPGGHHLRVPTPAYSSQSTGNFGSGAAAGGCGAAARSAPATPLQLDSHPRHSKHDKNAVKPLSSSVPSDRTSTLSVGAGAASDASEGKIPGKSRQKKFLRHFPQVGPDERVLNYYSCALVGDILLQGHLYITKNYFAFYSNVFGYVTKLLIPTTSVLRVTKEKMARIIPNAVGVCTRDERHVFGSLLSRDSTYKLMTHVWKASGVPEIAPSPPKELRISEADLDSQELDSPEDESSSGGAECSPRPAKRRESESIIAAAASGAAVIQPALLTGAAAGSVGVTAGPAAVRLNSRVILIAAAVLLTISAICMGYRLYNIKMYPEEEIVKISGTEVYSELVRWRTKLHGRAASELHAFLTTNLLLLTKVRQSLETLSSVILTDVHHPNVNMHADTPPNHTSYS